jgi:hypothetical protein
MCEKPSHLPASTLHFIVEETGVWVSPLCWAAPPCLAPEQSDVEEWREPWIWGWEASASLSLSFPIKWGQSCLPAQWSCLRTRWDNLKASILQGRRRIADWSFHYLFCSRLLSKSVLPLCFPSWVLEFSLEPQASSLSLSLGKHLCPPPCLASGLCGQ